MNDDAEKAEKKARAEKAAKKEKKQKKASRSRSRRNADVSMSEGENSESGDDNDESTYYQKEKVAVTDIYSEKFEKHESEKEDYRNNIARNFDKMEYYINCDFNLLVYGVGSKLDPINNFTLRMNLPFVIVNGFHTGTTIKSVLNSIQNFVDGMVKKVHKANYRKYATQSE